VQNYFVAESKKLHLASQAIPVEDYKNTRWKETRKEHHRP